MDAMRAGHELERRRAFRAEAAVRYRRPRVAFDIDDLLVLYVDQLAAADGAVGTNGRDDLVCRRRAGAQLVATRRSRALTQTFEIAIDDLFPHQATQVVPRIRLSWLKSYLFLYSGSVHS